MTPIYIRKSMIETYKWCPYQYYLTYIDKIPIPVTYAMVLGTRFHDFAEQFFDISEPSTISLEGYTEHEKPLYEWFVAYEQIRKNKVKNYLPYALEIKLQSERLLLSGTIDRIDIEDDSTYTVVEYKTGKKIDDNSIVRQCSLYKLLIEDTLPIHISKYRAINPRIKEVREYEINERDIKKTLQDIELVREATVFKKSCSLFKYPYCKMCTIDDLIDENII